MKSVKNLQEELNKELNNKRLSDAKIENLTRQIQQEKQNKKLPKDIEKAFKNAIDKCDEEMQVLINQISEKTKEFWKFQEEIKTKSSFIAEKYGLPISYYLNDTEYWYGPETYDDKWSEYEELLINNFDFSPGRQGWTSSSC